MDKLRWAVCGAAGLAGTKVVRDGLLTAPNCALVGLQSQFPHEIEAEGARYGVPGFLTVEEMLDQVECDAVYVATPQFLHLENVRVAAEHGKHVLCEKPLATTVADAEEIVALCARHGVRLGVDFNYRYQPLHQQALQLIRDGVLGEVVSGRCQFGQDFPPKPGAFRQVAALSGGGALGDTGNHAADLLEYLMGTRTRAVLGLRRNVVYAYETEDAVAALLDFEDGRFGLVDAYFCCPLTTLRDDVEINGTQGTLHSVGTLQMETIGSLVVRTLAGTRVYACPPGPDMYEVVFEQFAAAVLAGTPLPVPGEDGLHSQKLIEAVYRSSDTGCRVELD